MPRKRKSVKRKSMPKIAKATVYLGKGTYTTVARTRKSSLRATTRADKVRGIVINPPKLKKVRVSKFAPNLAP